MRGVLVTHMHFDHLGLAGRVRQASRRVDRAGTGRPRRIQPPRLPQREGGGGPGGGVPARPWRVGGRGRGRGRQRRTDGRNSPRSRCPTGCSTDGELADVPGWKLRAVHTPGHTPGHLCFVDERSRGCSRAITCCRGSPRTSRYSGAPPPARSGTTWTRWPARATST